MATLLSLTLTLIVAVAGWLPADAGAAETTAEPRIEMGQFEHDLLPRSMNYGVLLPAGYDEGTERYPVLFPLYPGPPDSHLAINRYKRYIELAWELGLLPPAIVITPAIDISMYIDPTRKGKPWEDAFTGPFLDHLEEKFRLWKDRPPFYASGLSAGGAITLRLGLKNPDRFGGIAALAPGIEAAFEMDEVTFEDTYWRSLGQYEGVDPDEWARQHPLNIAQASAQALRKSGMGIYLEAGDIDAFMLHRGTELLHRVLMDNDILHEYHLRRGVDHHVGTVMPRRWLDAYGFLGTHMRDEPTEPIVAKLQKLVGAVKEQAARDIPNDPKISQLRMPIFGLAAKQREVENKVLSEMEAELKQQ